MFRTFHSKILLFGEYALMCGSEALSIPYNRLYGRFSFEKQEQLISGFKPEEHLHKYLKYLKSLPAPQAGLLNLNIETFATDLEKGLTVESNIPPGYGLGSSGALVAAVYDRYAKEKPAIRQGDAQTLEQLRTVFSIMESYFHGTSSGFDPLTCYLNRPVKRNGDGTLSLANMPGGHPDGKGALFLLDTRHSGETMPLVKGFMGRCKDEKFQKKIRQTLNNYNRSGIEYFLKAGFEGLQDVFQNISAFTREEFSAMIPEALYADWDKGLESGSYSLKLCGSGGGGMMLGYTADMLTASKILDKWNLYPVIRF